jgi:predicted phage terminase large subunit-like protein
LQSTAINYNDITEAEASRILLDRQEQYRSLSAFTRKAFSIVDPGATYEHNWHVDLVCEFLEKCLSREIKRGIINIPPGYLKSITANVALPAFALGHNPSERIVSGSYSEGLSLKHSVDCRLVIQSDWYKQIFPDVILTGDQNTKQKFQTTDRGQRYAVSVGGTVTGDGGNILIVDDPVNPKNAMSDTERTNANNWFDQTFYTRLRDKKNGVIIIIMQRLHQDDLTGHLMEKGGWELLSLPVEAEKDETWTIKGETLTRKKGELLHPEREGKEEIRKAKIVLGSYGFAGQYQQRPSPLKGGMIDLQWFKRYTTIPKEFIRIIQSWDTASKDKEINDPSVCQTWGETTDGYYLIDVYRDRIQYPQLERAAKGKFRQFNPSTILIEDKSSGISLIQTLRQSTDGKYPVIAIEPEKDKVTRMSTCTPTIEAGYCYLPVQASWLPDYESELMNFPNSTTKDNVDATSQFLNYVREPKEVTLRSL